MTEPSNAVSANDIAAYIFTQIGAMTAMKLHKLLYYCQAWSIVWDEEPLFREQIEAWANGPVVPQIYQEHKGKFRITTWPNGNASKLNDIQKETVDSVLNYYGKRHALWLSDLIHREDPWRITRKRAGLAPGERGVATIGHDIMEEYYSSLPPND